MRQRTHPTRFAARLAALAALVFLPGAASAQVETPFFAPQVERGELPPVRERLPQAPLVADLEARGRTIGRHGGDIVGLVGRARDIRYVSTSAYARLVGYDENLVLKPDILERVEIDRGRVFTFHLRPGHRWSDGHPFTSEDFRYWWEDIANNRDLAPAGVPEFLTVEGEPPKVEILDAHTVRYSWSRPNGRFMPQLAAPRDPYIYRPAHYLKRFHAKYAPVAELDILAKRQKLQSWAALHNFLDDMNEQTNPELPTLQGWRVRNAAPASRFVFERNPYYHRVDARGQQLPYVDRIIMDVAAGGLMAAKANAGEVDLLFRGLTVADVPILKEGEKAKGYRTLLWRNSRGSEVALYPNLNAADPVWRALNRDPRYRRALSLGIDRRILNNALFFGLGAEGNNTVMEGSPLFRPEYRTLNAGYDPEEASRLLDEVGLTKRNRAGTRLLPDGRELGIVVEVDGENALMVDALTLIGEFWRELGVRLFVKPQDRTVLRNRVYSGSTVMSAGFGLDNAVPTAVMPPNELAPVRQDTWSWPKWGQFVETKGKTGEPVDIPEAKALMELHARWLGSDDLGEREEVWRAMLQNHAEQQWIIGTVAGAPHPVVARSALKNVPKSAFYGWEPTALMGVYRLDEFFWDLPPRESRLETGAARP